MSTRVAISARGISDAAVPPTTIIFSVGRGRFFASPVVEGENHDGHTQVTTGASRIGAHETDLAGRRVLLREIDRERPLAFLVA
jgi:hypothetical protein